MTDFEPPRPNAQSLPAADVSAPLPSANIEYEAFPVKKPEEDINDFKVQVRASTLNRARNKLASIADAGFPWYELCLGISSLCAGTYLGSLTTDIKQGTLEHSILKSILPIVAVATLVAYYFLRRQTTLDVARGARDVLAELPDPEKAR
jgi:hypothetical protein